MLTEQQLKTLIDTALDHARGKTDGTEVHVFSSDYATSRFANNSMTQNQAPMHTSVSVRVLVDGKQARLTTDKLDPDNIRNVVDKAIVVAKLLEKDPKLLPVLSPSGLPPIKPVDRYDEKTGKLSPEDRAKAVTSIISVGKPKTLKAAGTYSSGVHLQAMGNSAGLYRYHQETGAGCSLTMCASDSTGWAKQEQPHVTALHQVDMAQSAASKAVGSANPQEIDPGHYTVILEPSAVLDMLGMLWHDFTGTSYTDKLSCFLDKLNTKVFGENITIHDDVYHPLQAGAPFDGEGVPRKKVTLVEKGVVKNLVHGRRSAKEFGVEPTGHGLMEPTSQGEYPVNIVVEGGDTSLEEMIRTTDRGILLTRVWYVREVDPTTKIVTGMTRDGTFLVENGQVKHGVKNLRFNESIIEMLNRVIALGPSVRIAGEESFPAVVPPMKVAYFNFESTTKF